jgi:hypothetical protein
LLQRELTSPPQLCRARCGKSDCKTDLADFSSTHALPHFWKSVAYSWLPGFVPLLQDPRESMGLEQRSSR